MARAADDGCSEREILRRIIVGVTVTDTALDPSATGPEVVDDGRVSSGGNVDVLRALSAPVAWCRSSIHSDVLDDRR